MANDLSYREYLTKMNEPDSRRSWINWKIICCGMEPKEAYKVASDPDWGWSPTMLQEVDQAIAEFKQGE